MGLFNRRRWICYNCGFIYKGNVDKLTNQKCPSCQKEYPGYSDLENYRYCPSCGNDSPGSAFLSKGCPTCGYKVNTGMELLRM